MLSPVRVSSVTFVHPTQSVEIFGNVSTPFSRLPWPPVEIVGGHLSVGGGVKHKRTGREPKVF